MGFTSYLFILFLIVVFFVYYLIPKKLQPLWLLICSYGFYAYTGWYYLAFLLFSTLVTFLSGIFLGKLSAKSRTVMDTEGLGWSKDEKKAFRKKISSQKWAIAACGLVLNFGMLAVLKYFIGPLNHVLTALWQIAAPGHVIGLVFPLGISFYVFQSAGYVIDCYRGTIQPERNILRYALFVSYFPQLVQGPIGRYGALANQLTEPHYVDYKRFRHAGELMLWGYFKKVLIADRLAIPVSAVIDHYTDYSGSMILAAVCLYALQLYADFSGGIDIALGVSQGLGITLDENFKRPFFSQNLNEFWQRWHITLGGWFRDYVFYPIAVGKRMGRLSKSIKKKNKYLGKVLPNVIASFLSFVILGIWHGSQWKYAAFGIYTGGIIAISTLLDPVFAKMNAVLKIRTETVGWRIFRMLRTFGFVVLGLYFIRGGSFLGALDMLRLTVTRFGFIYLWNGTVFTLGISRQSMSVAFLGMLVMIIAALIQEKGIVVREALDAQPLLIHWAILLAAVFSILIFGIYGTGYDAAAFIYETF